MAALGFAAQVAAFGAKVRITGSAILRKTGIDTLAALLENSPVKEGRFRGNWRVGINRTKLGAKQPNDKTGARTLAEGTGTIAGAKWKDAIHLSNNVPYAQKLEKGSSVQARDGVVAPTVRQMLLRGDSIVAAGKALQG